MAGSRQDQYAVSVIFDGENTGIWDKMTGGSTDSDDNKYRPGGMAPSVSLGGNSEIDDIGVSRLYDLDRDHNGLVKRLLAATGRARITVIKQPLDGEDNPFGEPLVYSGTLKGVSPPEVDSESSDPALLEITVVVDGTIG